MTPNDKKDRPEAYPKPTETDVQLENQPEYVDQQPNSWDEDISDMPAKKTQEGKETSRVANDPR